jgi:hypothetical protein
MADLVVRCARGAGAAAGDDAVRCAPRLTPDNITPSAPLVLGSGDLSVVVVNPGPGARSTPGGVCLGAMLAPGSSWDRTGVDRPDGSYALCRFDDGRLELLTDPVGSRTMWYVMSNEVFLASTSQRALVALLRSYEPNDLAASWLVSSGAMGAESWDRRLRVVPPATRLTLDRRAWSLASDTRPVAGSGLALSDSEHVGRLRESVIASCAALDIDLDAWLLPLSGGYDSRALLLGLLAAGRRPRCVTWGVPSSPADPTSDAAVARRLSAQMKVPHEFVAVQAADEPVRDVLTRFLVAGEGRTDQLAGYIDGLRLWKRFFEQGVAGVIRGDEPPLGAHVPLHSYTYTRRRELIVLVQDYPEDHLVRRLGLTEQPKPALYDPLPGESIPEYHDRLYEANSLPFELGCLNDIKCKYVEVANPLLAAPVVRAVRDLPEHLRPERETLRRMLDELGPALPYADHSALAGAAGYLRAPAFTAELVEALSSRDAERVCSRHGLDLVIRRLERPAATTIRRRLRQAVRTTVPASVRHRLIADPPLSLPVPTLALRLYMAVRMDQLLREDASALAGIETAPGPRVHAGPAPPTDSRRCPGAGGGAGEEE